MNRDFRQWLRGIWTSFCRWWKRLTQPNRKTARGNIFFTPIKLWSPKQPNNSVGLWEGCHPEMQISNVIGVEQFRNAPFLPIDNLMSQVQWRMPKSSRKATAGDVTIGSIKSDIQWD